MALGARSRTVDTLRIAFTGTNSRPFVLVGTDAVIGRQIDDKALREFERLVQRQVQPMRTMTTSAHYRRLAAAALARRLTRALFHEQRGLTPGVGTSS